MTLNSVPMQWIYSDCNYGAMAVVTTLHHRRFDY